MILHDGGEAEATSAGAPTATRGVIEQRLVGLRGLATIAADPEGRWIDAHVEGVVVSTRLDGPDIGELEAALLRELDSLAGLLPGLAEVVAVDQLGAKEDVVVGGEETIPATACVEGRVVDDAPLQGVPIDIPALSIERRKNEEPALGADEQSVWSGHEVLRE